MKADSPGVGKAPGAGRPRDPRIDAAILAAAAELLVEVGYANLSLAAVAARAGTTKTALYRRWPNKAELIHEAAFPVPPTAVTSSVGDTAADIRSMVAGTRDAFTASVVRAALPGLIADMANDEALTTRILSRFQPLFDALRQWAGDAQARGRLRAEADPDRVVEIIGGAALFALLLHPRGDLDDGWVERTATILIRGVIT